MIDDPTGRRNAPGAPEHPRLPMSTCFVGDVHGCAAELEELLAAAGHQAPADRLLLTGDAFSRGPDPLGVWRAIRRCGARMVLGNHDAALLARLRERRRGVPVRLHSEHQRRLHEALAPVADELTDWLAALPVFIREPSFTLVHAGVHPTGGLQGTTPEQFLNIRLWPPAKGIHGPRWHEHYVPAAPLLVFGHDAPGGLVVRRHPGGRPYLVGLDTGCVYGHRLSAYLLEEDRIVQVPCHRTGGYWRPS